MSCGGDNLHNAAPCFRVLRRAEIANTETAPLPAKFKSGGFACLLYLRNQDTSANPAVTGGQFEGDLRGPKKMEKLRFFR
jgi:hypothetical protein